MNLIAKR